MTPPRPGSVPSSPRSLFADGRLQLGQVPRVHKLEILHKGEEKVVKHLLAGAERVAMVRPWKELFRAMISLRPRPNRSKAYFRAVLMAPSLASAPELQKNPSSCRCADRASWPVWRRARYSRGCSYAAAWTPGADGLDPVVVTEARELTPMPEEKSTYCLPSGNNRWCPCPDSTHRSNRA